MGALAGSQNLMGGKDASAAANDPSDAWSPRLVDELRDEHRALVKRHGEIEKLVLSGHTQAIPHGLSALKSKFNVHTLRENLHCYTYLERALSRSPMQLAAMMTLREDMDLSGRQLLGFVEKYRNSGVSRANAQEFLNGLRAIGRLLQERIQRVEAELYPLYKP